MTYRSAQIKWYIILSGKAIFLKVDRKNYTFYYSTPGEITKNIY